MTENSMSFGCACRFVRENEFEPPEQIEWCGLHGKHRAGRHGPYDQSALDAAVAAERERCAKLCDPMNADRPDDWTEYAKVRAECAARIRNFGKD